MIHPTHHQLLLGKTDTKNKKAPCKLNFFPFFDWHHYFFQLYKTFSLPFFSAVSTHHSPFAISKATPHWNSNGLKGLAGFSDTRQTEPVYNPPVAEGVYNCEKQKSIKKYKRRKIVLVSLCLQAKEQMLKVSKGRIS